MDAANVSRTINILTSMIFLPMFILLTIVCIIQNVGTEGNGWKTFVCIVVILVLVLIFAFMFRYYVRSIFLPK